MIAIPTIIEIIKKTLAGIDSPRFFKTERGFQGEFAGILRENLKKYNIFPNGTRIEEEYQKTIKDHGIKQRPDLIIHIPVEESKTNNRKKDNFVVFAFKLHANASKVKKDFGKLNEIIEKLDYLLGIFITSRARNYF